MYGVGSAEAIFRDTSVLFSPTFKHSSEFMNSDLYEQSSGLTRYRSAPSSFFDSLVHGGDGCDNFLNAHQSSTTTESESMFARLLSSDGSGDSEPHDLQFSAAVKHEIPEQQNQYSTPPSSSSQMIYQSSLDHNPDFTNQGNSVSNLEGLYKVENGSEMENQVQGKVSVANCSNLIRQSSSPPVFFSDLTAENGFAIMRDAGEFRVANGTNVKVSPTRGLNDHMNFSSGPSSCSRFMPQIAENRNESNNPENGRSGDGNGRNEFYSTGFQNESWNDPKGTGLKRDRDAEEKFSGFNALESQSGSSRNYTGLTHHLSLPKTSAEMAAIEKYLQFQQESVPCKIRAKRGCATHPRSIAERMRRTRISERMKKLQDLFPNMDKQTNTAEMLDLAVEYIKDLQQQVKTLTGKRAKCTCSIKLKQISSPTA